MQVTPSHLRKIATRIPSTLERLMVEQAADELERLQAEVERYKREAEFARMWRELS